MSDIQFVFEKPQKPVRTVRKRTRLITSCDACRIRKVKCRLTGRGDDKCESCEASGSVCVFEERNRIRSQRGIATFTVAPTRHSHKINPTASLSGQSCETILPVEVHEGPSTSGLSSSSPSTSRKKLSHRNTPNNLLELPSEGQSSSEGQNSISNDLHDDSILFDPRREAYPHPKLLSRLVDLFFLYAGYVFPFFDPVETARCAREGSLSPLIANCLAAYSARFCDEIGHEPGQRHLSGEPYLNVVKSLLFEEGPSKLEQLHAMILIAWTENGSGRSKSCLMYSQMASSLAAELHLYSEELILQEPSEELRDVCRLTFWSVVWLDIIACSVNGKCCLLRLDECSTSMPYPQVKTCGTLSRTIMYQAFKGVLSLMVSLNVCSNYGRPSSPSTLRDVGIRQIQYAAETLKERIPPSLAFNKENLSFSVPFRDSFPFYLVHALIHCFLIVSHCPSIFWSSQPPKTVSEMPRLDIAWSSAIAIIDILSLMQNENLPFATGVSSAFLPLSIARGAFLLAQGDVKGAIRGTGLTVDDFQFTNSFYLARSAELLRNLSRFWASMAQIEISNEIVPLYGAQTIPRDTKFPLRSPLLQYMPLPYSVSSVRYIDGSKELEEHLSQAEVTSKVVVGVNNLPPVHSDQSWQDVPQLSSNFDIV
ncbi:hypothetical protein ACEPAG_5357 [Sanghuangporus baumii]